MAKTHYNILSFSLAALVASAVLIGAHGVRHGRSGQALAAPSEAEAGAVSSSQMKAFKRVAFNPEYLLGLKGQEITSLLKTPELVRQELPVTIWQYRAESCVLDVYFKSSKADISQSKAVHYELRSRTKDQLISEADCSTQIVKAQNGVQMVDVSAIFKSP